MKKIYLLAGALVGSMAVSAQAPTAQATKHGNATTASNVTTNAAYVPTVTQKAAGVVLWESDFSDATDWTTSENAAHTDGAWSIVADLPAILTTGLETANGGPYDFTPVWGQTDFALINSDAAGGGAVQDAYITSGVIDVSTQMTANGGDPATDRLSVQWVEIYRRFQETYSFEYTNDGGTTWEEIIVNFKDLDEDGDQDVNYNSQSPSNDPDKETEILIIEAPMGGWSDDVQIRFHYVGTWDWFWAVDDVSVSTQSDNDMRIDLQVWGSEVNRFQYFQVPTAQAQPIVFEADVRGYGINDQTDVALELSDAGVAVATSNLVATSVFDQVDSLGINYPITMDGTYDFSVELIANEIDDAPENSTYRTIPEISVGGDVYAAHVGPVNGDIAGSEDNGTVYEMGNFFEIQNAATVYSIDMGVTDVPENAEVGVYAVLYQNTVDGLVSVGVSDIQIIDASELGTMVRVYINGTDGVDVEAGLYMAAIGVTEQFRMETAGVDVSGTGRQAYPDMVSAPDNSTFFGTVNTPMVQMNFEAPVVGLEETVSDFSVNVYPNPAASDVNVAFTLNNNAEVSVNITDLAGKVVYTNNLGNVAQGTHMLNVSTDALTNGVYFYNVTVGNEVTTEKLVIKK